MQTDLFPGALRQTAVVDALCGRAGILGHGAKLALALLVLSAPLIQRRLQVVLARPQLSQFLWGEQKACVTFRAHFSVRGLTLYRNVYTVMV